LARDLRRRIVEAVERNGGHLASNLGAVELTIALHRVFDLPRDRLLWDVSHQCYAHKLLSGRDGERFRKIRRDGGYCGYCDAKESPYDLFTVGHGGTALSAALGLAVARDLRKGKEHVVALLGDGSLSCGLTQEALQQIPRRTGRLIIVLNDNGYAIDALAGAWADGLAGGAKCNVFSDFFGLAYRGEVDGHDFDELLPALEWAKNCSRPVLVHVRSQKGRGHRAAEDDPVRFHNIAVAGPPPTAHSYGDALGFHLCELAAANPAIVAVTAAMGLGTGLRPFAERFPDRFFDVSIAEGHAITFAAGLARGGLRPLCAIYSSFAQRAVDNWFHDVCLQNLPVVLCMDRAGLSCADGDTHHGLFDIALFSGFPNCTFAQPSSLADFWGLLEVAFRRSGPFLIRYRRGISGMIGSGPSALAVGRAAKIREGEDVSLWALGQRRLEQALELANLLEEQTISAEVVDGRFVVPLDRDLLAQSARRRLLVSLEDHVGAGGFGSHLLRGLQSCPHRPNFLPIAWPFPVGFAESDEILEKRWGQSTEQIFEKILVDLGKS
jgi:1-deoxy-D-xylulose-5-phosphate synthase